jgi:hypothetical protein
VFFLVGRSRYTPALLDQLDGGDALHHFHALDLQLHHAPLRLLCTIPDLAFVLCHLHSEGRPCFLILLEVFLNFAMLLGYFFPLDGDVIGILGVFVFLCVFVAAEEAFEVSMLLEEVEEVGEVVVVGGAEEGRHLHLEQSQSGLVRVDFLLLQEVVAAGTHSLFKLINNPR